VPSIRLPTALGHLAEYRLRGPRELPPKAAGAFNRVAYAAAHVVADPLADVDPWLDVAIDWDRTIAFREHLWDLGLGVAEAMDTAQRNMGLDWPAARELVRRSAAQAAELGARIASGAGTDHRASAASIPEVLDAYREQVEFVQGTGSRVVLMASRELARLAAGPDDYLRVYDALLAEAAEPVILHWLGEAFDPGLAGYWGSADVAAATDTVLDLVRARASAVDGVKVSLLSAEHEVGLRARLPERVRLYTGDDLHYPELIRGDGTHHSDALLGAFAAVAPAASAALAALDDGDLDTYDAELAPTLPLSRHIFAAPTSYYKTGIAFLSWLTGRQPGFTMVGGLQSARSVTHLATLFALANEARLLPDPELAADRLRCWLAAAGVTR
jgi:hypothetical protein